MTQCKNCGSYAINHHRHGRDGSDGDLCDVCYWRTRAQQLHDALRKVAQSLAWQAFGECRSYGEDVPLLTPAEADDLAKTVLKTKEKRNEVRHS